MNTFPPPSVVMIWSVIAWFVIPVAMLVLVAVGVRQMRLLNRNMERLLQLLADRDDRKP